MAEHKNHYMKKYIPYFLTTLLIAVAYLFFYASDLLTFLSFILLLPIFLYFGYDCRIPVGFAAVMLLLAGVALSVTHNLNFANLFAIYAYWLVVVGVICLTIKYMMERRK